MKISIAMATYNGSKYILEQLESFAIQTKLPDEVIVSDDGSSDETIQIVNEFLISAPFDIVLSRNPNDRGYASNFCNALSLCSGDLIFLSDQDDVWFPEKIEQIEAEFIANPDLKLVIHDAEITDNRLSSSGLTKLGQIKSASLNEDLFVMGCCVSIRKNLLELFLPIPMRIAHDDWLVGFSNQLGLKEVIPKVYQYYRQHGGNTSIHYVNNTRKATGVKSFLYKIKQIKKSGTRKITLERERDFLNTIIIRMHEKYDGFISLLGNNRMRQIQSTIEMEIVLLDKRLTILQSKRLGKVFNAFFYWLKGGYKHHNGYISAIRDMVD